MRVKSIVINGFKSYAHRQELSDLDPHFNAITGLNGSGKSNVFDALCWVMGISALKKVRAEDPSDLIFKNGNTGVTSASVTLEFYNDDPDTAPTTHPTKDFPTITVTRTLWTGGREQFRLNQKVTDHSKIKQFFHHCSMNVDNPHFLVLQGTIHKMIGMKSQDILGLLEEACGTRVFDARRRIAENLIKSKERKLDELNKTIDGEIAPLLTRMKAEQDDYEKYQRALDTLEIKRKFRVAHNYWQQSVTITDAGSMVERKKRALEAMQEESRAIPQQKQELEAKIGTLEASQEAPREEMEAITTKMKTIKAAVAISNQEVQTGTKQVTSDEKQLKTYNAVLAKKQKELESFEQNQGATEKKHQENLERMKNMETSVEGVKESIRMLKNGVIAGANGMTLPEEKSALEQLIANETAHLKTDRKELGRVEGRIKELEEHKKENEKEARALEKRLENAKKEVQKAEEQYKPYADAEARSRALVGELQQAKQDMVRIQDRAHSVLQQDGGQNVHGPKLDFQVQDQSRQQEIDAGVCGKLGGLIKLKDDRFGLALTQGAGPQNIYKVVVSSDEIAQAILDSGNLTSRISFLALNKVSTQVIDAQKLADAQRLIAGRDDLKHDNIHLASDLVDYDPRFEAAIQSVFGKFFVVNDKATATAVAFDPKINVKCVTLGGDVVDPMGIMTGGHNDHLKDLVGILSRSGAIEQKVTEAKKKTRTIEREIDMQRKKAREGTTLLAKVNQANQTFDNVQAQIKQSGVGATVQSLQEAKKEMLEIQEKIVNREKVIGEKVVRKAEVEKKLTSSDTETERKQAEQQLKQLEGELKKLKEVVKAGKDAFLQSGTARAEIEQLVQEAKGDIKDTEESLAERKAQLEINKEKHQKNLEEQEELKRQQKANQEKENALIMEIDQCKKDLEDIKNRAEEIVMSIKDAEAAIKSSNRQVEEAKRKCRELETAYAWIPQEKSTFGSTEEGSAYYFEDSEKTKQTLEELKEDEALSDAMSRKVNKKATMMYDNLKKEYEELLEKRRTLDVDRNMIYQTITTVENKKWKTLDVLVQKVSKGFSQLFATCLPGASCKLLEERDQTTNRLLGLSVKVAFHGKEKESLSELSGGQRSLLALCLILAILKFFKAPVYILDEVDAALDPSHTQNIGLMLRKYFSNAQFLLVSLKDGMVSNANIIYEVRNTQGFSEVTRNARKINAAASAGGAAAGAVVRPSQ